MGEFSLPWFLINASPDLRLQIEQFSDLFPDGATRKSPIAGVVVTGADIDQIAGLLSLRELHEFVIYATPSVRRILRQDNSVFGMLNRKPSQVQWVDVGPASVFPLSSVNGQESGISCETFSLGKSYPVYVKPERVAELAEDEASLGLILTSITGQRLAYLPSVPRVDRELKQRLDGVDLLLFDGTFWSDDELLQLQPNGATAAEMGHISISGPQGSLAQLADLQCGRKVFIHMNNTNPILDESSSEHAKARSAGWAIAEDGWQFNL